MMTSGRSLREGAGWPRRAEPARRRVGLVLVTEFVCAYHGRRHGAVAEWLGRGLQSLVQRFESARRLRRWTPNERAARSAASLEGDERVSLVATLDRLLEHCADS